MSENFNIIDKESEIVLEISVETPLWKIPKVLGESYSTIQNHIATSGAKTAGAPYARYLDVDWNSVKNDSALSQLLQLFSRKQKMMIGMPVEQEIKPTEAIQANVLAKGRHVQALHRGPFHKIGKTYKEIAQWADQNNVTLDDNTIESYVTDPGETPADKLKTMIFVPVKSGNAL